MPTEYAIRTSDGTVEPTASQQMAVRLTTMRNTVNGELRYPGAIVVTREVTEWTEAPEPSAELVAQATAPLKRKAKAPRLTPAQRAVLTSLAHGRAIDHGISGQAAYGGLSLTIQALRRRGWLELHTVDGRGSWSITAAGLTAIRGGASR